MLDVLHKSELGYTRASVPLFRILVKAGRIMPKFDVVTDPLALRSTQTKGGAHLHVRTGVPLFGISLAVGDIVLKLGMWIESSDCIPHRS